MKKFYGHFAAAYGTCWFGFLVLATLTQSQIELGALGYLGFPVVSILYGLYRWRQGRHLHVDPSQVAWLREHVADLEQQVRRLRSGRGGSSADQ